MINACEGRCSWGLCWEGPGVAHADAGWSRQTGNTCEVLGWELSRRKEKDLAGAEKTGLNREQGAPANQLTNQLTKTAMAYSKQEHEGVLRLKVNHSVPRSKGERGRHRGWAPWDPQFLVSHWASGGTGPASSDQERTGAHLCSSPECWYHAFWPSQSKRDPVGTGHKGQPLIHKIGGQRVGSWTRWQQKIPSTRNRG